MPPRAYTRVAVAQLACQPAIALPGRAPFEARAMESGKDPLPAASRRFRSSDKVVVELEPYGPADPRISASLLNAKGESMLALAVPPLSGGKTRFALPLSSLATGPYVLRLEARAGNSTSQDRIAFRVIP